MQTESQNGWSSYVWLVLGTALMYFSNWNWAVPIAAWLFSVFLLRFTRTRNKKTGLIILCSASMIAGVASMWRLLSVDVIPPSLRIASGLAAGLIFFLPFLVDRLLVSNLPGWVATLVFPCAWVAMEYSKTLGYGSWGALAYTQYGNLPLMQLSSITGIWGLSFLITWFASIVNFAWERQFAWIRVHKIAILYLSTAFLVFMYGYGRLSVMDEATETVCIASVTNPRDFFTRFYGTDWGSRKTAFEETKKDFAHFSNATLNSAKGGSRIVLLQEYGICVRKEDEQEFISRAKELAQRTQLYLVIAIGLFPMNYPDQPWQNKLIWIDPVGKVLAEYFKSKPAPPLEPIIAGDGRIPILETIHGRIASAICADLDYPGLIRQAGSGDADILLIPAQDWEAVDPLHSHMTVFRAIENGVSVIKSTGDGLSIAVTPYGLLTDASGYPDSSQKQMVSCVPNKGIATVYSKIGDAFAWLCISGLVIIAFLGCFNKRFTLLGK